MSRLSNLHTVSISSLPSWASLSAIPPGTYANISLNTQFSQDPGTGPWRGYGDSREVFKTWTGGVYAPAVSQYGGVVAFGGGHGAYSGNEAYLFDLTTRLWRRVGMPSNYGESSEVDGEFPDGQPMPPHTYHHCMYQSPANGGGAMGSFVFLGPTGSSSTKRAWRLPLDTGPNTRGAWSKFSNLQAQGISMNYSAVAYDPTRNLWWINANASSPPLGYLSPVTGLGSSVSGGVYTSSYKCAMAYYPPADLLIIRIDNNALYAVRLASGYATSALASTGPGPTTGVNVEETSSSFQWVDDGSGTGYIVAYSGLGLGYVTKLVPPAGNPLTGTWTWVQVPFTGVAGATPTFAPLGSAAGPYGRFAHVPILSPAGHPTFVWAGDGDSPVQLWRF